jgi:hypothetical protein
VSLSPTPVPNPPTGASRSTVRVKAAVEYVLFVVCVFSLPFTSIKWMRPAIFLLAFVAAVAPYFIKCETCKSGVNSRYISDRNLLAPVDASGRSPGPSSFKFFFASRCPHCGMERI